MEAKLNGQPVESKQLTSTNRQEVVLELENGEIKSSRPLEHNEFIGNWDTINRQNNNDSIYIDPFNLTQISLACNMKMHSMIPDKK